MILHGWWQWSLLGLELAGCVLLLDWARREMKYGGRMAAWRVRRRDRSYPPPFDRADYIAALIHARDNGDLLATRDMATAEILRFPKAR
jgi:hypothetical protein